MTTTSPALCLTQYLLNLQMITVFAYWYCTNLQNSYEFTTESLIQVTPYVHLKCITLPPDLLCLSVEGWTCPHLWGWNRITSHSSLPILYCLTLPPQYLPSPCSCLWFIPSSLTMWHSLITPCSLNSTFVPIGLLFPGVSLRTHRFIQPGGVCSNSSVALCCLNIKSHSKLFII